MCSVSVHDRGDLTAKAAIRDEALRLFAAHGPDSVSLRRVAAAAGVSPGLVAHHYTSKAGLRAAVDAHVTALFDRMFTALGSTDLTTGGASFAEVIVAALPPDSPVPGYLSRLLTSGDPVGVALFTRWYTVSLGILDQWDATGLTRPSQDPAARAAFLVVNDLAMLLLREHIGTVLGVDPLTRGGMNRWLGTGLAIYRDGLFATPEES